MLMDLRASIELESIRTPIFRKNENKVQRLSAKDLARRVIHASSERKEWLRKVSSKEFILAEIPISSAVVIDGNGKFDLKASLDDKPIVVDSNKNKAGRISRGDYFPPVIVIEGAARHNAARFKGKSKVQAWIGSDVLKVLKIHADDQFGAQELNDKLSELLREKYVPKKKSTGETLGPYPWMREVYPFELYFVYNYEGKLYKQKFTCDMKKRTCKFDGEPIEVKQEYVDLAGQTSMERTYNKFIGNQVGQIGRNIYNRSAPGTGVGPKVNIPVNPRSELGRKTK